MPRPKKPRFVSGYPTIAASVPRGMPISGELMLSVEDLEAIRLSDFERLDQESAAGLMQVSRQTYGRILSTARVTVGEALVTGKSIRVAGGTYAMRGGGRRRRSRHGRNFLHAGTAADEILSGKEVMDMPRGDGTGPDGQGRRSGKGQGPCGQSSQPTIPPEKGGKCGDRGTGQANGRGGGRGQGGGQGRRRGPNR